ncbi:hypothetical protein [Plebeiibacterium sediminum]|uniref:Porin n=1 Tax=Plebeiibacterium sediminum TaxID=2992112 RepID=A0AAE3M579_9BACT|nr:hypothetical protein [Plebeiobacterium sediminum]MCW3787298.1 hypothetical protein [Plebeiobacterium sediminum]
MKKFGILTVIFIMTMVSVWGQEDTWEVRKHITGYVATEFNYFDNLKGYDKNIGVSVAEAGFLFNYQPIKDLKFKVVAVYRPNSSVDQLINEINAEYKVNNFLNVKAGRFLTPLSPINTFYYAPVNVSATLPLITNLHQVFPLNMDAISLNGSIGNDFKFGYDLFAGGYRNSVNMKSGAMGFYGTEADYFENLEETSFTVDYESFNTSLNFGGGGHIQASYKDMITVGFNVFKGQKENINIMLPQIGQMFPEKLQKDVYGFNFNFKHNSLNVVAEWWDNDMTIMGETYDTSDGFVIVSNTFNKLTPYVRYEQHTAFGSDIIRYAAGVNYKPIFETTLKLEYLHYDYNDYDLNGLVASVIYSF